jgi:hypothetical protein
MNGASASSKSAGSATNAEALKPCVDVRPRRFNPVMATAIAHQRWPLRVTLIRPPPVPAQEAKNLHRGSFFCWLQGPPSGTTSQPHFAAALFRTLEQG